MAQVDVTPQTEPEWVRAGVKDESVDETRGGVKSEAVEESPDLRGGSAWTGPLAPVGSAAERSSNRLRPGILTGFRV